MSDTPRRRPEPVSHRLLIAGLLASAGLVPAPAHAQRQSDAAPETITVTARKRAENAFDVPISMTVLKADTADTTPITPNAALSRAVPNLSFVDGGGMFGNSFTLRGVGAMSPLATDDTSVVIYVDDVPQPVLGIAPSMLDVARVEVLRGPQGTLTGRNTEGGAVQIVTNRPTFTRQLSLTAEAGSNGYYLGQAIANGALVPGQLAARLAVRWTGFGGDIPNVSAGGKDGGATIGAVRGSLLFTPDARTEALLTLNYGKDISHSPRFLLRDTPRFPVSATDPRTLVDGEAESANLRVRHDFDHFALSSQTSFQHNRSSNPFDPSDALVFAALPPYYGTAYGVAGADVTLLTYRENAVTQEIRASSLPGDAIGWTVGINYFHSDWAAGRDSHAQTANFVALNGLQDNRFHTNSYAAFGEATVPLTARLKASFGLRGTLEHKSAHFRFNSNGLPGVAAAYAQDGALSDNFVTGRAALSYDASRDLMLYGSVARGYVTAGFPAYSVNSAYGRPETTFPASTSWAYEAGFKSHLLAQHVTLNGSVFLNDVKNGHLVAFDATQALYTTVALDYRSYGGELDLTAKVTPAFDLFGGIGYTHATLRHVPVGSVTGAQSGNDVPNVPGISGNIGGELRWSARPLGLPGGFSGRVTHHYIDSRAADIRNSFRLRPYNILDGRLTWQNGAVSLYAFANNLLNQRYQAWGQAFGTLATVRAGQGRVVGGGASLQF